uniref:FHA domain-containing protein n=1 Tax=Eptatretus burgeri TaxID=7764 RepID=A0A8C4Q6J4_EPTBU
MEAMSQSGTIVIIKRNGKDGINFPLLTSPFLFGRSQECDIRIQLGPVSAKHCQLVVHTDGKVHLQNLSKVNPTVLNGKEMMVDMPLSHKDVFTICDRSFRFEYDEKSTYYTSEHQGDRKMLATLQDRILKISALKAFDEKMKGDLKPNEEVCGPEDPSSGSFFRELYTELRQQVLVSRPPDITQNETTVSKENRPICEVCPSGPPSGRHYSTHWNQPNEHDAPVHQASPKTQVQSGNDVNLNSEVAVFANVKECGDASGTTDGVNSMGSLKTLRFKQRSPVGLRGIHKNDHAKQHQVSLGEPNISTPSPSRCTPDLRRNLFKRRSSQKLPGMGSVARGRIVTQEPEADDSAVSLPATEGVIPTANVNGKSSGSGKKRKSRKSSPASILHPIKKKRVTFGASLSPELFDMRLPPHSPIHRGSSPASSPHHHRAVLLPGRVHRGLLKFPTLAEPFTTCEDGPPKSDDWKQFLKSSRFPAQPNADYTPSKSPSSLLKMPTILKSPTNNPPKKTNCSSSSSLLSQRNDTKTCKADIRENSFISKIDVHTTHPSIFTMAELGGCGSAKSGRHPDTPRPKNSAYPGESKLSPLKTRRRSKSTTNLRSLDSSPSLIEPSLTHSLQTPTSSSDLPLQESISTGPQCSDVQLYSSPAHVVTGGQLQTSSKSPCINLGSEALHTSSVAHSPNANMNLQSPNDKLCNLDPQVSFDTSSRSNAAVVDTVRLSCGAEPDLNKQLGIVSQVSCINTNCAASCHSDTPQPIRQTYVSPPAEVCQILSIISKQCEISTSVEVQKTPIKTPKQHHEMITSLTGVKDILETKNLMTTPFSQTLNVTPKQREMSTRVEVRKASSSPKQQCHSTPLTDAKEMYDGQNVTPHEVQHTRIMIPKQQHDISTPSTGVKDLSEMPTSTPSEVRQTRSKTPKQQHDFSTPLTGVKEMHDLQNVTPHEVQHTRIMIPKAEENISTPSTAVREIFEMQTSTPGETRQTRSKTPKQQHDISTPLTGVKQMYDTQISTLADNQNTSSIITKQQRDISTPLTGVREITSHEVQHTRIMIPKQQHDISTPSTGVRNISLRCKCRHQVKLNRPGARLPNSSMTFQNRRLV